MSNRKLVRRTVAKRNDCQKNTYVRGVPPACGRESNIETAGVYGGAAIEMRIRPTTPIQQNELPCG